MKYSFLIFVFSSLCSFAMRRMENIHYPTATKESPYDVAASFPGGVKAQVSYYRDSIRYPEPEKSKGLQGNVSLKFTITKEGKIKYVIPLNGVPGAPNLVKEAIRLVLSMPNWIPATKKEKPVESEYYLTIPFILKKH